MSESESLHDVSTPDLLKRVTVALSDINDIKELMKDMRIDLNRQEKTISRLQNELTRRLGR